MLLLELLLLQQQSVETAMNNQVASGTDTYIYLHAYVLIRSKFIVIPAKQKILIQF